ncbi:TBC1 domain family member 12-like [Centruroides sculpturatus]|uniref:TBC1 domain family member 12-like n=1 Tax=Centruroides sculpturatus TaxID=218467 RepID=UPI000C6DC589|nr:TBC1 domain family member 12-like [Centruroides sculpturatus]
MPASVVEVESLPKTLPSNKNSSVTSINVNNLQSNSLDKKCSENTYKATECNNASAAIPHQIYEVSPDGKTTLDNVLDSIPLVYNPSTRQIHLQDSCVVSNGHFSIHLDNGKVSQMGDDFPKTRETVQHFMATEACEIVNTCNESNKNEDISISTFTTVGDSDKDDDCIKENARHSPVCLFTSQTDASSFTSASSVSTGTEFSLGVAESYGDNKTPLYNSCDNLDIASDDIYKGAKPKKRGFSSIFSRTLLPWKTKETKEQISPEDDQGESRCPSACSANSRHSEECVASSTTALILENRPTNLPAKHPEEESRHKLEYEEMVKAARKKEQYLCRKDAKKTRELWWKGLPPSVRGKVWQHAIGNDLNITEELYDICVSRSKEKIWISESHSDTEQYLCRKDAKKTRELWWKGLPPSVRGKVWQHAIGNDLNITEELYDICVSRSKEKIWISESHSDTANAKGKEGAAEFIKLDVSRTFPQLGIFQEGGPYYSVLQSMLGAYVIYRPDIGYVQGMSFIAAMLLLNMDAVDAFICFANLLNRPCQLAFFRVEQHMMTAYYSMYEEFFKENLGALFNHFDKQGLSSDLYLVDWIYTLFSRSLPLDVACRVWDVFLRDGEEFLFRTALVTSGATCSFKSCAIKSCEHQYKVWFTLVKEEGDESGWKKKDPRA